MTTQRDSRRVVADKLPQSLEAERSVLGAILLDQAAILKVLPILREVDCFVPSNREIFRAMQELQGMGQVIDPVILVQALSDSGRLNNAGGAAYVSSLPDGMPRVSNVEEYANIVAEKSKLRRFVYLSDDMMRRAQGEQEDFATLVEQTVSQMLFISNGEAARAIGWKDALMSGTERIESDRNRPVDSMGMQFGLTKLDTLTGGLRRRELAVIFGPTSNGKSLLAEQLAITSDDAGFSGLIFSAEMTAESIAMRQASYEADVPLFVTRRPDLIDDEQIARLKNVRLDRKLAIVDSGITPERIWALCEARKRSSVGLDFVIVDYDQLVIEEGIAEDDENSFFVHQGRFINRAQKFAKRLDVAFIVVCQMRKIPPQARTGGKFKIFLDDIYGHSAVRNAPDVIICVFRDFFLKDRDPKFERDAQAHVVKARNGETGRVKLDFDPRRVRFSNRIDPPDVFADASESETETETDADLNV